MLPLLCGWIFCVQRLFTTLFCKMFIVFYTTNCVYMTCSASCGLCGTLADPWYVCNTCSLGNMQHMVQQSVGYYTCTDETYHRIILRCMLLFPSAQISSSVHGIVIGVQQLVTFLVVSKPCANIFLESYKAECEILKALNYLWSCNDCG